MATHNIELGEDHPLTLELESLRASIARYQHETHAASVKLQRHSFEASQALEKAHTLERENARLYEEIQELRSHPVITPHPAALQASELTLALRNLSDKLNHAEEALLVKTNDFIKAQNEILKAQMVAAAAHAQADYARAREEEVRVRERELERKARAAEEKCRLSDLVVQEYADLVRKLEGRQSKSSTSSLPEKGSSSNVPLIESLAEGKLGLQRLLEDMNGENDRLGSEISRLQVENESLKAKAEAEAKAASVNAKGMAENQIMVWTYQGDKSSASKMVARYMKFSQTTIDQLQQAMENIRLRHLSAQKTLEVRIDHLQKSLASERRQAEKLRQALDELSEDISREAFGRRREISLRLAFLGREEALAEGLRRWIRKAKESLQRSQLWQDNPDLFLKEINERTIADAEALLEILNGQPAMEKDSPGSVARVIAAQDAVISMTRELRQETDRRLDMQRRLVHLELAAEALADKAHSPIVSLPPLPPQKPPHAKTDGHPKHGSASATLNLRHREDVPSLLLQSTPDVPEMSLANIHTISDIQSSLPHAAFNSTASELLASNGDTPTTPPLSAAGVQEYVYSAQPLNKSLAAADHAKDKSGQHRPEASAVDFVDCGQKASSSPPDQPTILHNSRLNVPISTTSGLESPGDISVPTLDHFSLSAAQSPLSALNEVDLSITVETLPTSAAQQMPPEAYGDEPPTDRDEESTTPHVGLGLDITVPPVPLLSLSSPDSKQTLLPELKTTGTRYDELQKLFRDCHAALKEIKRDLPELPRSVDSVIRTALERLNDYSEDARVELEIRVADEERLVTGYEALLSLPGVMTDDMDEDQMIRRIKMFIDGTDEAVVRNISRFTRKLDDLQHDVACIKRYLHELAMTEEQLAPTTPSKSAQGWSSWTAGILGPLSQPASPAPTFGSVMTSPRISRQASFSSLHKTGQNSRAAVSPLALNEHESPFSALDLRIPMPAQVVAPPSPSLPRGGTSSFFTTNNRAPKPRVSSATMYMLGIGARKSSFGLGSTTVDPSPLQFTPKIEQTRYIETGTLSDADIE